MLKNLLLASVGFMLFMGQLTWGQGSTGTISGTVRDASGAVIPRVAITLRNLETGVTRTVTTDDQGRYNAPTLSLGNYQVRAEISGFQAGVRSGIQLTVGQEAVVDFALQVGEVTQTVEVTGEAPLVETTSGAVSGLVGEQQMRDLPLNGRSFDQLIALQAGTTVFTSFAGGSVTQGSGQKFSVAGARWRSNRFYQDGTELSGAAYLADQPGSAAGLNLGVEAIREFRVLTNSYSPEYGKRIGAAVITVTRSGTNSFHGSAFEFLRNSTLDARNFFDPGSPPAFRRNNIGGSLGGPLRKDKTFFFLTYEGLRQSLGLSNVAVVPDQNAHNGFVPGPGGILNRVGVDPRVAPYLALYPLPNGSVLGDGTGIHFNSPAQITNEDYGLARVDHTFSDSDSAFITYNIDRADQKRPLLVPVFADLDTTGSHVVTLAETHIFSPALLNDLRFGFNRPTSTLVAIPQIPLAPSVDFIPGEGFGDIVFTAGNISPLGDAVAGTFDIHNIFQVSDQVFYTRGKHSFTFGAQLQRIQRNENAQTFAAGRFEFSSLQGFLQGNPNRYRGGVPAGLQGRLNLGVDLQSNPWKGWRQTYYAGYVRDKVTVTSNLTLDLGLRYESLSRPSEVNGRLANMVLASITPGGRTMQTKPVVGEPFFATSHSIAPRLGLAWDPTGRGKTSVRAGWGMFYEQLDNDFRWSANINPPFILRADWVGAAIPGFPHPFEGSNVNVGNITVTARAIDPNLVPPTLFQYNVTLEREITPNTLVRAAYVGSHGSHLASLSEVNLRLAQFLPDGTKFFDARQPFANPILGPVYMLMTNANSFYNSLALEIDRRIVQAGPLKGLGFHAAYTFSKSMDDASSIAGTEAQNTGQTVMDPMNLRAERALSAFDVRSRFVLNFTWDLPTGSFAGGSFSQKLLQGWQLNGITSVSDGIPFNIEAGFNVSQSGGQIFTDRPNLIPGGNSNPVLGGPNRANRYFDALQFTLPLLGTYGNLGRDTAIGPGLFNQDFSLTKNIAFPSVSEAFKVQFKAEFFNIFNRANFGGPGRRLFDSRGNRLGTAGLITNTRTTSRQIQFGLKILF